MNKNNLYKVIYITLMIIISYYQPVTANNKVLIYKGENTSYYLLIENYRKLNNDNYEFFLLTSNKENTLEYKFRIKTKIEDNQCFIIEVDDSFKDKKDKDYLILTVKRNSVIARSYRLLKLKDEKENP